jgi:[ribosomal protein S5]-alanine N-acetyltransferase
MTDAQILPLLQGPRVQLRMLRAGDVAQLYTQFSDPKVMRYWSRPPLMRIEEAQTLFEELECGVAAGEFAQWAIARRSDDLMIGSCALFAHQQVHRRAAIGYALASAHWGHGYAHEALRLALDHAFGILELHRLEADVDPRNVASTRLLEKLGFVREGVLRERWHVSGELQDSAIYALLARDYAAASTSATASKPTAP